MPSLLRKLTKYLSVLIASALIILMIITNKQQKDNEVEDNFQMVSKKGVLLKVSNMLHNLQSPRS